MNEYTAAWNSYLTMLAVALPASLAFRLFVARELGTDDYLFWLLNVTGTCFSVTLGDWAADLMAWRRPPPTVGRVVDSRAR